MRSLCTRLHAPMNHLLVNSLFLIAGSLLVGCGGTRDPFGDFTPSGSGGAGGATSSSQGTAGGAAPSGGATAGGAASTSGGGSARIGLTAGQGGGGGNTVEVTPYDGVAGAMTEIKPAWDYNGIIGTGQSLAVGTTPLLSTKQLYNNLMLSLGTAAVPPWDSENAALSLVPLIERKNQVNYPSPYPLNLYGETPHSSMANQITAMVRHYSTSDYVSVHSIVGESGQGIEAIKKLTGDTTGTIGRAYAASLFEAAAINRLAKAAGKTYGIAAIVMTHGETDSGDDGYRAQLVKLLSDYNADLATITGQTTKIPMFLSQQFAFPSTPGQRPVANQIQWKLGVELPGQFVCTGPKFQYPGHSKQDGTHLSNIGYQLLGEKTGQVYYERIVMGRDWQPLQPVSVVREGTRVITVNFHVPVPPLNWDNGLPLPDAWPNGRGFEVRQGATKIAISSVEIVGDAVKITCASDLPASGFTVGYAMTANSAQMAVASYAWRWGQLRDSDPFVGTTTHLPQPNYAVSFEMPVPAS